MNRNITLLTIANIVKHRMITDGLELNQNNILDELYHVYDDNYQTQNQLDKDPIINNGNSPSNVINYYYDQEMMKNIRGPNYANPYEKISKSY